MKNVIKKLVEQVLDEVEGTQQPTVYFDMDGVLANFQGAIEKDDAYNSARVEFIRLAKEHMPELLDYHTDDLKTVFKGRQEDPIMAKLKKLWNKRRSASFTVAGKPGHFRSLEPLPGAREMMKYATKLLGKKPHVLTAPMQSAPGCEKEKREWVDEHVAGLFDEFHCTQDKDHFAHSEFDILIDDRPKYVNKFRAAGGTAILHTDPAESMQELTKIVKQLTGIDRSLEEINAISAGGASMQSSGRVSGTGGNPLGRDMSDEHERMWSGDKPEKNPKKARSLKEEFLDEDDLEEFNAVGTGAVAGYTLPLGMAPSRKDSKKKNRPRRWYEVQKESKNKRDLEEQVKTYSGSNWEHVPIDALDETDTKAFQKLYRVWAKDGKELVFEPNGLVKDAIESDSRGMWQPGTRGPLAVDFKKQQIDVRTNLKDPRVAIALKTSLPWLPQLAKFDVVKLQGSYAEDVHHYGKLENLLSGGKIKKIRSKQYRGKHDQSESEYAEFEQYVLEEVSDHPWFHATKLKYLSSIMKKGLLPSKSEEISDGGGWSSGVNIDMQNAVYLTASEDYASQIADTLLADSGGDEPAVILQVSGDALQDPSKLIIDEDAIRHSAFGGQIAPGDIKVGMPDYLTSAIDSIESIGYEGVIGPEFIKVFEVVIAEFEYEDGEIIDAETVYLSWDEWKQHSGVKKEERIGSRGSVDYFQMGSSLPDHLYNLDNKGRPTRDPGLGGNTDKKKKKKREKKKKTEDRPGKRWYDK